jgi:hypothetical protein
MTPRTLRANSLLPRLPAHRRRPSSGWRRARPGWEPLESRLVLSTYTWTGWVNDSWDNAGNWLNDQVPVAGSAVLFQPLSSQTDPTTGRVYPVGSTTIDLGSEDVSSIQMNGSYEFVGDQSNSSLTLDNNATITTATGAALNFDEDGDITNDITVNFSGSSTKSGDGALGINTQLIGYGSVSANALRPITIGSGPITVGNSTSMLHSLVQVDGGATLVVPGGENPSIGSLSGGGIMQMGSANDPANLLSINTPQGNTDVFNGTIEGANGGGGPIEMNGAGSLTIGTINPDGTGLFSVTVNSGTLLASSSLNAQTLTVGSSFGNSSATFGGPAAMTITGLASGSFEPDVTFNDLATFAVALNGAPSTGAFTQLTDTDTDIDPGTGSAQSTVQVGGSQLSVALGSGYTPEAGDRFTIISTPNGTIHGRFANAADGSIDIFDNVPFRVNYNNKDSNGDATSITLTVVTLPTTTTISLDPSSTSPSTYGQTVTFDAQVVVSGYASGTPTAIGSVDFFDGDPAAGGTLLPGGTVALSSGTASFGTATLSASGSPYQIYAEYIPESGSLYTASATAQPLSQTVHPATLTAALIGTVEKTYNGTTVATLAAGNYQLSGIIAGDIVSLNNPAVGTYSTKDVGTLKTVSVSGLALSGASAGNYQLASTTISAPIGQIIPKALALSGLSVPSSKVYDGTTAVAVSGSAALGASEAPGGGDAADGRPYAGDAVALVGTPTATYNSKDVTAADLVTFGGLSLSGAQAADYALNASTQPATITPRSLTVTGLSVGNKVYDGTTAGTPNVGSAMLLGVVAGDTVSLNPNGAIASFSDPNVGTGKPVTVSGLTLAGPDASDYTLSESTVLTASISPAGTTMSLSSSANPSRSGATVTITATVAAASGPPPAGSVTFSQGTTTLAVVPLSGSGTAVYTTSPLEPGDHPITAAFASSTGDDLPVAASLTQAANPNTTTVTLTLVNQRVKRGKRVYELIAIVSSAGIGAAPSGTVAFQRKGIAIGSAPLQGGVAVLQIGRTRPKNKRFTATFQGSPQFSESTVTEVL